jgi:adenosylhomocysteine nucleosidase
MPRSNIQVKMQDTGPKTRLTAIVAALPEELAPLLGRTDVAWSGRLGRGRFHRGTLRDDAVVLAWTGDGAQNAERGLGELLRRFPVRRVLVLGISGGLSPDLGPGDLHASRSVLDGVGAAPAPDATWFARALDLGVEPATFVTARRVMSTPEDKQGLWRRLRGESPAAVVDLETARYAKVAARSGIPYLAVRSVCDPAEEGLPFDLNQCMNERGGISRVRVLRHALLHPAVIGGLWQLRRRLERCSQGLADIAERLVEGRHGSPE